MNSLEKFVEKNKKHANLVRGESQLAQILCVNYISLFIVACYEILKADTFFEVELLTAVGSSLAFSVLLSCFGGDMVIRHWIRIVLLTACNAWFCYYWIWVGDSRAAFFPLALVVILWKKWFFWQWYKELRNDT